MKRTFLKSKLFFFILPVFIATSAIAQPQAENEKKLMQCINLAHENAKKAIDFAIDWRGRFGGLDAENCLAIAYIENEEYETGAKLLSMLSIYIPKEQAAKKTTILSQSANGYLLANMPNEALDKINLAIELSPQNAEILLDRARTFALLKQWGDAESDLTQAMKLKGLLPFALRLRAEARLQQRKYDLAESDIKSAIILEPKEGENYFVRGRIREAKRLGHAPN